MLVVTLSYISSSPKSSTGKFFDLTLSHGDLLDMSTSLTMTIIQRDQKGFVPPRAAQAFPARSAVGKYAEAPVSVEREYAARETRSKT